jgi:hypothetical protein
MKKVTDLNVRDGEYALPASDSSLEPVVVDPSHQTNGFTWTGMPKAAKGNLYTTVYI